jgi:hypothetical protein
MNLALLVTKKNLEDMTKTALRMGEMQEAPVNGAFCVFYDSTIPKEQIARMIEPISKRFPAMSFGPIQINGSMTADLQAAVLFGNLIIQAYSRYPGAWIVADTLSIPLVKDFMQASEKQHKGFGGGMSGRGVLGKGSICPVGPVVFDLPQRSLKFLRYPVNVSWRERGKFQFARYRFAQIDAKDYLWSLSESKCEPKVVEEVEEDEDPNFEEWDKPQLIAYITEQSGHAPARNTGLPRLIETAKQMLEYSKQPV